MDRDQRDFNVPMSDQQAAFFDRLWRDERREPDPDEEPDWDQDDDAGDLGGEG
jgi:hypothetical protein